jgi:hypothetical protein
VWHQVEKNVSGKSKAVIVIGAKLKEKVKLFHHKIL